MRLRILAVGRAKSGPEAALVSDYMTRTDRTGRALGLGPMTVQEVEDRRGGGQSAEAALLLSAIPEGAQIIVLDERGKSLSSRSFATQLANWRDDGVRETVFVIGGGQMA